MQLCWLLIFLMLSWRWSSSLGLCSNDSVEFSYQLAATGANWEHSRSWWISFLGQALWILDYLSSGSLILRLVDFCLASRIWQRNFQKDAWHREMGWDILVCELSSNLVCWKQHFEEVTAPLNTCPTLILYFCLWAPFIYELVKECESTSGIINSTGPRSTANLGSKNLTLRS